MKSAKNTLPLFYLIFYIPARKIWPLVDLFVHFLPSKVKFEYLLVIDWSLNSPTTVHPIKITRLDQLWVYGACVWQRWFWCWGVFSTCIQRMAHDEVSMPKRGTSTNYSADDGNVGIWEQNFQSSIFSVSLVCGSLSLVCHVYECELSG